MSKRNNEFFWGDKWSIDNNEGWFVAGNINALFCVDMERNDYRIISLLPDYFKYGFRMNSNCIKYDGVVFCLPDKGDCIWCYDLSKDNFTEIKVENPNHIDIMIGDFWKCGNEIWAVSVGLKQIIEIDIKKKKIVNYYTIPNGKEVEIANSAKEGNYIYIVSATKNIIYEFNIKTRKIEVNEIVDINDRLRTISICDGIFWLSGYKRKIYLWDKKKNKTEILDKFPQNFGLYNFDNEQVLLDCERLEYPVFSFLESISVGNYIWFIPFQTNQILYVDKDTYGIKAFQIEEENESVESIRNREMDCKYVLQYIYEERYIGLYSFKNEMVFEIDVETLELKKRIIMMEDDNLEEKLSKRIWKEYTDVERTICKKIIKKNFKNMKRIEMVGKDIYNQITKSQ